MPKLTSNRLMPTSKATKGSGLARDNIGGISSNMMGGKRFTRCPEAASSPVGPDLACAPAFDSEQFQHHHKHSGRCIRVNKEKAIPIVLLDRVIALR